MTQTIDHSKTWQEVATEFTVAFVLVGALFITDSIWMALAFTLLFLFMLVIAAIAGAFCWVAWQVARDFVKTREGL